MEGKVARKARIDNRIMLAPGAVSRIDGFHTAIKADDEIIEIQTNAQTIGHGYLLVELAEAELSARLVGIIARVPNIAGVNKESAVELPEKMGAVFKTEVEFQIAGLVDEVDFTIGAHVATGTQAAHIPAAHTVCSSGKITLFIGHNGGVAVWNGQSESQMESHRIAVVDDHAFGVVEIELRILRINDVEEFILSMAV